MLYLAFAFLITNMKPIELPVWPGAAPDDSGIGQYGKIGPERIRKPEDSPTKDAIWITGVTKPTITVFPAAKGKNTGTAVIVCPGGGYWNLAWDLEGTEVAEWLNSVGITAIVLKYRCPRRVGTPERLPAPGPLQDAQRAVSLVRSKAAEWGIDPHKIGMTGFSAGGHLVLATAAAHTKRTYNSVDDVDKVSCRPDFVAPVYPGYFIENKTMEETHCIPSWPATMPPVFLVHASDDSVAFSENSLVVYRDLRRAGLSAELHIYSKGEHGFGVRKKTLPGMSWPTRFADWMRDQGFLK